MHIKRTRPILLSILLVLCVVYYVRPAVFKETKADKGKILPASDAADLKTERIQSFILQGFSETGKKKWQVNGETADIVTEVVKLSDITADVYGDETNVNLKADRGVFDRRSNNLELMDNVVVVTTEGTRLTTEKLNWNAKGEQIDTDLYVHIERQDMEAEGIGALAKPNLKTAQLNKDVRVNVKPATVITCVGPLEIDYNNNVSYFNKDVKLDDTKTQIYSDKATAFFNPKNRTLTKVICDGNVKIVRGENVSYAEGLTYLPDEGRVILSGRPKIIINSKDELMMEMEKK